ncbi:Os01g0584800, partial [Oryza sativa Japonica Group]
WQVLTAYPTKHAIPNSCFVDETIESRKQSEKLIAAVDPARHAKRKLRIAAKHREHKRRKIMTMKMGRWLR